MVQSHMDVGDVPVVKASGDRCLGRLDREITAGYGLR